MSLISVQNLTFSYDGSYDEIFSNTSFQIDTDWKLGFIGRNGRGKTTFFNLLMGKYEYRGTIAKSVEFEYFPYNVDDEYEMAKDIVSEIVPDAEEWQINKELSLLEMPADALYRPFCTLSKGEQTKVLLAALFLKEDSFLLIDEPTNHLDLGARNLVGSYLEKKKSFILISHDRNLLDRCIDHVISINRANIVVQKGNFSSFMENKDMQDSFETAQNERLKKDIKRLSVAATRTKNWSDKIEASKIGTHVGDRGFVGHQAAKMMKRSKSIENRINDSIDEKSKLLKNVERADSLAIKTVHHHNDLIVEARNLSIFYGDEQVVNNLSFEVRNGERVLLKGKNGSGKSSVIKLILGEDLKFEGSIKMPKNLKISYVSQDTSHLTGDLKLFSNKEGIDESLFKAILRKLDFEREQFDKNIEDMSAGQKKKVLIAKSLCERANLYIWDEPLNFVDVISRMQIENLILENNPTMLFVEHDAAFSEKVATKIIEM